MNSFDLQKLLEIVPGRAVGGKCRKCLAQENCKFWLYWSFAAARPGQTGREKCGASCPPPVATGKSVKALPLSYP